ncbi:MAG: DUF1800 domain-containing protein [Acidobacteriota bacterium]
MKRQLSKAAFLLLFALAACFPVIAQDDPDPNSAAPLLASGPDAGRVLAVNTRGWWGGLPSRGSTIFTPSSRTAITIFVSGIATLDSEGPNAFRVYIRQQSGKTFEMQTDNLTETGKRTYAIGLRLYDAQGFRGQPVADGDSLIYVTWRGQMSNALKIGLGSMGKTKLPDLSPAAAKSNNTSVSDYVGYRYSGDRKRLMEQATFGPTTNVDFRIRRIGLRNWVNEQIDAPYPTIPYPSIPQMSTIPPLVCQLTTNPTCYRERYTMTPVQKWFFQEAMYGDAQLRHRTAWALSQILVTSGNTITQSSHELAFFKILSQNAFGNYRTLLSDATLSPTMGQYLDMVRSTKDNPNENYPREILQLFSIGLYMLNQDGTPKLDSHGDAIPTYSQETINNFSKVFTGWTFCNQTCANSQPGIINYKDPMILVPANHDTTSKTLLNYPNAVGASIPACAGCTTPAATANYAQTSLNAALDNIFNHPNLGPYIGRLMIQHLVTSDPSPAYVARVAGVFDNNGSNVRGDMRAVVKAILLDPEARGDVKTAPRYGKLREPVQLITNLARLFPARDFNGENPSDGALAPHVAPLGQNPFYSPTVFNYFTPDYDVPQTTLNAPEFQLLNSGTAVKRTNLLSILVFEGITPNATDSLRGISLDYSELIPAAEADASGGQLVDALDAKMMHSTLTPAHRSAILSAVQAVPSSNPALRVKTGVYLIAVSSQYQVQR